MSVRKTFTSLAVDLGAESGRVILGGFDGARMQISDVHRFPNRPVSLPDGLHWNLLGLWQEILTGIQIGLSNSPAPISSIGVDT